MDSYLWITADCPHDPHDLPGCFCLGLGRLVTHVCGHIRTLQGCKAPSRKRCLVSDIWMPPRGAFGSVLAGTRARQYTPTWWMLSMAWWYDEERMQKTEEMWKSAKVRKNCLNITVSAKLKATISRFPTITIEGKLRSIGADRGPEGHDSSTGSCLPQRHLASALPQPRSSHHATRKQKTQLSWNRKHNISS